MVETTRRPVVRIDEELCNGCGACVTPCAEGAIEMVDGKAHVIDDALCDGAGFCLAICPTGALKVETCDTVAFDAREASGKQVSDGRQRFVSETCFRCDKGERDVPLMPVRYRGESLWVCTRCLPALIHG
jgi:MinD superfamily P-loop ATPase